MSRTCGDCTACCTVMGVKSINKPERKPCPNLCASGCSIYADRPEDCRDFACVWLVDDGRVFRNMERPDRVGILFDATQEGSKLGQALIARPVRPGAFSELAAKKMIDKLAKRTLIVIIDGEKRKLIGPDHLVEKVQKLREVREIAEARKSVLGDSK